MVGESVTRKERATQGCDPRRIRVTRTPRPNSQRGKHGDCWFFVGLVGGFVRGGTSLRARDEADTKT
jgi:hypothetical protein